MKRLYLLSTLLLVMAVVFLPRNVKAQVSVWDGTAVAWTQGSGTQDDPYLIESAQNLAYLCDGVGSGNTYSNKYFKLTTDINLASISWTPIGDATHFFSGKFDGDNHFIDNIVISSYFSYMGLFGVTGNGFSCNNLGVRISMASHSENNVSGGLIGSASGEFSISNCYTEGTVRGGYCAGGIIGMVSSSCGSLINNCYNKASISSTGTTLSSSTAATCEAGGIVGAMFCSFMVINKCYNNGSINTSSTSSVSESYSYSGGIVGFIRYFHPNGAYYYNQNNITNCYNTGLVSSYASSSDPFTTPYPAARSYSGGIIGEMSPHTGNNGDYNVISSCYNIGSLSASFSSNNFSSEAIEGGIVAKNNSSYVHTLNCYYLNTCGGTGSGTSQTASQMKASSFPTVLNTDSVVFVKDITPNINQGYPVFGSVRTLNANNIGMTTATLNGDYLLPYNVDAHGFEYKKTSESNYTTVNVNAADSSVVSHTLTNLQVSTQYVYRFFVQKEGITYRGSDKTFNTNQCMLSAQIEASSNILCAGDTLSFTVTANPSSTTSCQYVWNTGSSQRNISVNQPGTYIATVTDIYGCTASDTVVVNPFDNPIITGNLEFCTGEYTTLTATGGNSYVWSNGANTPSITVNNAGVYTVTATSGNCSATASVTTTIVPIPQVAISGNPIICSGESTTLTASSGSIYLWSTGATTPSISVNNPGTYFVMVFNSTGCSSSASQNVSLMEPTTISGNSHICSGESTTLTAIGTGSYQWSNGAITPSITVNTPDTYSVTVSLPNGCSSSAAIEVTAASSPTPSISGNNVICEGQSTTLTATGGNNYSWNNGSTQNSIVVTQSGNYTVTVTNTDGCSASTSTMVTVNPLPNVSISGNSSFCQGGSTTLTASGANTYLWSNASTLESISVSNAGTYTVTGTDVNGCTNTVFQSVAVNPTYNIPLTHSICEGESYNFYGQNLTSAGTYTHTLQTINGCDSVLILTLTVKTLPTASITGNTTICEGQSTTLTATGGNSYSWSTGSTNSSISVNQSGLYTVTATNTDGCSASTSTTVTVNPLPTITISGNTTVCQGSNTTLTASGADSYSWSTGENTASVSISSFGIYTVTGTSAEGCSNTANVTVLVSQLPVITISGETDFCAGGSTTLTANGGTSYLWSDGTTEASITVNIAGTYQVIGYNTAGCNSMESVTVNQWQPASSEFTITTNENCYEWNGQSYCQTGDYTQTLQTIHGCDSIVTLHLTIETSINDHKLNTSMNVYPNPTSDKVNVQLAGYNGQSENMEIQLFDIYGKLLQTVPVTNENMQIDLSSHAQGVYFIKAMSEGNVLAVRKVVKNR